MHLSGPALKAAEVAAASVVLISRIFALPVRHLAGDPVVILALLWGFLATGPSRRAAVTVTLAASFYLFVAYAGRQIPFSLDSLRQAF